MKMEDTTNSGDVQSDIEVVKKMEDEHLRLQRQFRVIQTDRQHRTMGVHPQFRSQDLLLSTLKDEYTSLSKDLKIARSGRHKKNDKKMKSDLKGQLLRRVCYEKDCEGGYSIMEELDGLLQLKAKEMLRLRKLAIANQGELDNRRSQSEHRLMSSENKLEAAMLRFNTIQCENRKIREEIEHMLKDRTLFNQSWDKMLTALGTGKKFLSDLFESSTLAYDQRDEWCHKLRSIQEKGKMDQVLQVQEMRDLKKVYDNEMKIYNFLAKKGLKRVNKREEKREIDQKRKKEEEDERKYQEHVKLLDDITNYTQENNYKKIINNFVRAEFDNFSMYSLITDYCAENEVLSRDLALLRRDIEDRRDQNEMRESTHEDHIAGLERELEEVKMRTDELRAKRDAQDQLLDKCMEQVHGMFQMLECSLEPYQNLLGDKMPTLHTLRLSLFFITEKIKECIENIYYCEHFFRRKETGSKTSSRLKKFTVRAETPVIFTPMPMSLLVPADPCPSCIETRWLSRVSEAREEPFNMEQVLEAIQALSRDPAYVRSDRVHALTDCRATASRKLLATRHAQY